MALYKCFTFLPFTADVCTQALGNIFQQGVKVKNQFIHITCFVDFSPCLEIVMIVRQVVVDITLTPVRRKRRVQSAPNFRGPGDPRDHRAFRVAEDVLWAVGPHCPSLKLSAQLKRN